MIKVGLAGLGYWGPNLARNFDDLAELAWLCDLSPDLLDQFGARYPNAAMTGRFEDMLEDSAVQAVVIATPVTTHYELARMALAAGKHVFVEKPPALSGPEADELVALAAERDLVLLPGHLLLYHPAVIKLRELIEAGELGDMLYIYGNRQNLGQIRKDENALWSLGVHDLSVILHLVGEEPTEVWARGESFHHEGVEDVVFCYLRFPSGIVAHMHLSWLDPHKKREHDRRRSEQDGGLRRHGARAQGHRVRQGDRAARRELRRVANAHRRHLHPEDPERRAAAARVPALPLARRRRRRPADGGARRRGRRACARAATAHLERAPA